MKRILIILFCLSANMISAKVNEIDFHHLSSSLIRIYSKQIQELSGNLKITLKDAHNENPNSYASKRENGVWEVTIISSLLQLEQIGPASLGMILCHEIGHFLGGHPYVIGRQLTAAVRARAPKKMSAEGQADYFASQFCFKELVHTLPGLLYETHFYPIDTVTENNCQDDTCIKSIHTSYETTLVYQELMRHFDVHESFFGNLDSPPTDRTLNYVGEYPTLECRFETFVSGLTCDETKCPSRPSCWFLNSLN